MFENFTVLFVDDEENILNSLKRGLIDEEYHCLFANSAEEALKIMDKESISVIVSDMRMPKVDGLTLLREVKAKYPNTVRIVLSGYTQLQQVLTTVNTADIFKFITKPWKMENEFKVVINQALEYFKLQKERDEYKIALEKRNVLYQNILKKMEEAVSDVKLNVAQSCNLTNLFFDILIDNLRTKSNVSINPTLITNMLEMSKKIIELALKNLAEANNEKIVDGFILAILSELNKLVNIEKLESSSNIEKFDGYIPNQNIIIALIKLCVLIFTENIKRNLIKVTFDIANEAHNNSVSIIIFVVNNISFTNISEKMVYENSVDFALELLNEFVKHIISKEKCIFKCVRSECKIILKYDIFYTKK